MNYLRRAGGFFTRLIMFVAIVSCLDLTPKQPTEKEENLRKAFVQASAGDVEAMTELIENDETLTDSEVKSYEVLRNFAINANKLTDVIVDVLEDQLTVKHMYDYQ